MLKTDIGFRSAVHTSYNRQSETEHYSPVGSPYIVHNAFFKLIYGPTYSLYVANCDGKQKSSLTLESWTSSFNMQYERRNHTAT